MLESIVTFTFWMAWMLLAAACSIAANRIGRDTRRFVVYSVILLIIGTGVILMTASDYPVQTKACLIPIFLGIAILILPDGRQRLKPQSKQLELMDYGI